MNREACDSFQKAALEIACVAREQKVKTFVISGVQPLSGATSAAQNLALQLGVACCLKALVVEFCPRGSRLARTLGLEGATGFADVADDPRKLRQAVRLSEQGVSVLVDASGDNGDAAARIDALARAVHEATNYYDIVLIDAPAVTGNALTLALGSVVPRFVLVIGAGRVKSQSLDRLKVELDRANIEIAGIILNRHRRYIPKWVYRVLP